MIEFLNRVLAAYTFWGWVVPIALGILIGFFFLVPAVRKRPFLSIWIMGTALASIRLLISFYDPTVDAAKAVAGIISWTLFVGAAFWGVRILRHAFGEWRIHQELDN